MRVCCGLTNHLELPKRPDLYGCPVVGAAQGLFVQADDARPSLGAPASSDLPLPEDALEPLALLGVRPLGAVARIGPRAHERQPGCAARQAVRLRRGAEPDEHTPCRPP